MSRNKEFKCLWVNYFCACLSPQSPGSFQAMITETSPTERMWQQLKNYEYIYKSLYIRLNLADLLLQNKVLIKSFYTWWQNVWEQSTMKTSGGFLRSFTEFFTRKPMSFKGHFNLLIQLKIRLNLGLYNHINPVRLIWLYLVCKKTKNTY